MVTLKTITTYKRLPIECFWYDGLGRLRSSQPISHVYMVCSQCGKRKKYVDDKTIDHTIDAFEQFDLIHKLCRPHAGGKQLILDSPQQPTRDNLFERWRGEGLDGA